MKNSLEQKLEQKQQQRLIPMQLQLGKMLELNDDELNDLIRVTVDENPALTFVDDNSGGSTVENHEKDNTDSGLATSFNSSTRVHRDRIIENTTSSDPFSEMTVVENVMAQIDESNLDEPTKRVAEFMAGYIDSNGYFTRTKTGIADDMILQYGIEPSQTELEKAWNAIRTFDPPGIGATDLRDCLLLQLGRIKRNDSALNVANEILTNHYEDFLNRKLAKIASATGYTVEEVEEATRLISRLEPKPGRMFAAGNDTLPSLHITPDFTILPDIYNERRLSITSRYDLPEIAIDESFGKMLHDVDVKDNDRKSAASLFVKQRCEEAGNFIALLKLRHDTLLRIIRFIADRQMEFFLSGDLMTLKPMVLKDVAEALKIDISAVSRATSGRYVLTVSGIIALKALFNEKKNTNDGQGATELQITALIKELISKENPQIPLTDEQLTSLLRNAGYDIARRTVAKYREKEGIATARQRKRT